MAVQKTTFDACLPLPSSGFGGLAIGGAGVEPFVTAGFGGLAIGGSGPSPFITAGLGGLAIGGLGAQFGVGAGFGGLALGGLGAEPSPPPPPPPGGNETKNPTVIDAPSWLNPDNAKLCDGVYATFILPAGDTLLMRGTTFAFSLPGATTIVGIIVEVTAKESGSGISFSSCKIGGVPGFSNNLAPNTELPTSPTTYSLGSTVSMVPWGVTPTVAQVKAATFTVDLVFSHLAGMGPTVSLDCIRVTVYYT